jgi:hypothetical protein
MLPVVMGAWFALVGGLAALAWLASRSRVRRLRRTGLTAWAQAVPPSAPDADEPPATARRMLLRYAVADGRVVEELCPRSGRRAAALSLGQKVLVWYDPEDPSDVLVYGRDGRRSDRLFLVAGLLFIALGAAILVSH